MERKLVYFVSDVHLGLCTADPAEREERFVAWLKRIPRDSTRALYMLGDIWDFWYEYRDVVPKEGTRVIAQLVDLMDHGVEVFFFEGNHDMWSFSYFESLGMKKLSQPALVNIDSHTFCLGHGDGLGKTEVSFRMLQSVFHSRVARFLFSMLHPWVAFRFGNTWSGSNRRRHKPYHFAGEREPLYEYAQEIASKQKVDFFVFGHYHDGVDMTLPGGERLFVLKDWMEGGCPCLIWNGSSCEPHFPVSRP